MDNTIHVYPGDDLQEKLIHAPAGSCVRLHEGSWRQKVIITTPGLTITGAGAGKSIIYYDDYAKKPDESGRELVTFRTWTLAVCADDIHMSGLTISNTAGDPSEKGQEVALTVYGGRFLMEDCELKSTQDTLFLGPLPKDLIERYDGFLPDILRQDRSLSQRFDRCMISGSVDFIFGCGDAVFTDCEIRSVYDGRSIGFVAAPSHALSQKEGFRFNNCGFTCDDDVPSGTVYLARPWRDYGLASFNGCSYGRHISPAGFDPWRDSGRDKTARFFESPVREGRVSWINRT
jgi:pectinesterase